MDSIPVPSNLFLELVARTLGNNFKEWSEKEAFAVLSDIMVKEAYVAHSSIGSFCTSSVHKVSRAKKQLPKKERKKERKKEEGINEKV